MSTIPLAVTHIAITKLLIDISVPMQKLLTSDPQAPVGAKVSDPAIAKIEAGFADFLYGEQGLIATFSKDGTMQEIAQRHVDFIKRAGENELWMLSRVLRQYAMSCSKHIQEAVPELAQEIDNITPRRHGESIRI